VDAKTLPSEPKLPLEPTKAGSPEFTPDIEPAGPLGLPWLPKVTVTVRCQTDPSAYPIPHNADVEVPADRLDTVPGSQVARYA